MEKGHSRSRTSSGVSSTYPRKSQSKVNRLQEPFLHYDANAKLSFDKKSTVYCSLVALVKAEYPFDNALQDKAARFLKDLEPRNGQYDATAKLITDLRRHFAVISPLDCGSGNNVVPAEYLVCFISMLSMSLVESDLVSKVLATVLGMLIGLDGASVGLDN
ncbi:hypothetical protein BLNAU_2033 [Blattamonas nauphoetae]|uniref:Uncharacterized protein n=1 Tax=Blattamonas nauphoetae TaxID=2049346 RepID=A0ABQ9YGW8_9EUKA|nr:hypothetical protein BLNAU_2033 [Blattamonas nauphoetae]